MIYQWTRLSYEIHDKNKTRKWRKGRRRKRRISHRVLDHTYPELSVARAKLLYFKMLIT